jgi:hypothetical protein
LDKSVQKYLVMVKLGAAGATPLYKAIMGWKAKPMEGVTLEEAYQVFGKWDMAVLFVADTNENALHFVGDILRPVEGVAFTATLPLAPLRKW